MGSTARWRLELDEPVLGVELLPDGVIAAGSEGALLIADRDGHIRARTHLGGFLLVVAASPDGTRLAVGTDTRIALIDLTSATLLRECPSGWCGNLAWTAHSRDLAAADGRQVRVLDRDGHRCWTSPPQPSTVTGLAWLRRDARRIAAAAYQGVTIYEPATDRAIQHLAAPGAIAGLAVAPHGRWVVGGSQDATLHGWRVPAGNDFRMSGFPTTVSRLAFDPTGRWMANDAGDTLTMWDFSGPGPTGREALLAQGHAGTITAMTWTPPTNTTASRTLISADDSGQIAYWRLHPRHRPGDRIRPRHTIPTGDAVTALAATAEDLFSGHRSGAVISWTPTDPTFLDRRR